MKLIQQELREKFLNSIMEENNISRKSIDEYIENFEEKINTMDEIFDSDKNECIKMNLVLLSIISREKANENIKYFREVEDIKMNLYDTDIDKYKISIITALVHNIVFYSSACNLCGFIQREIKRINNANNIIGIQNNNYLEYLNMEKEIVSAAERYPFENFSIDNDTIIFLNISILDSQNKLKIINAFYDKENKLISIIINEEIQNRIYILWLINEKNRYEPIILKLKTNNEGFLYVYYEHEIPVKCKLILSEYICMCNDRSEPAVNHDMKEDEHNSEENLNVLKKVATLAALVAKIIELSRPMHIRRLSFTGTGHGLRAFGKHHVDSIDELHCGDFVFLGNAKGDRLEVRFQFISKKTGEPTEKNAIPYFIEVDLIASSDRTKTHTVKLNRILTTKASTISSGSKPIDIVFSKGFEPVSEIRLISFEEKKLDG